MNTPKAAHQLPGNANWKGFSQTAVDEAPRAHFYHANGFPAGVYRPLISRLEQDFNVAALDWRATWPGIGSPPKRRDWHFYADDLIAFIEQESQGPIIGIGHSMGATCTILAASKRPDLFSALVLIEPAMVSRNLARLVRVMPKALMNFTEPAKGTLKKRDQWPSRQAFIDACKAFRGYKRFNEEAFQALADHGVIETTGGQFELAFPKVWEAHNYTQPPNVMSSLERLDIPCVAIRGKPSVFFSESLWQQWQGRCPNTIFKEDLASGHLLPLENPSLCYDLIAAGLSELNT